MSNSILWTPPQEVTVPLKRIDEWLLLHRFSTTLYNTIGNLYSWDDDHWEWLGFTLEDPHQEIKIPGRTRISEGEYELTLRVHGGWHNRFSERYGDEWHKGMIELKDVPEFTDILIHPGNTDEDTAGCILVGDVVEENITSPGDLERSVKNYKRLYPLVRDWLLEDKTAKIKIV